MFLSESWFGALEEIIEEHEPPTDQGPIGLADVSADVTVNIVVTDSPTLPKGEALLDATTAQALHLTLRGGCVSAQPHHAHQANLFITTDYATAREVALASHDSAGLDAFFAGRVLLQGDLAALSAHADAIRVRTEGPLRDAIRNITA